MTEIINKVIDILKSITPFIMGWLGAKADAKIDKLEDENEQLKKYNEIDNKPVSSDDAYAGMLK